MALEALLAARLLLRDHLVAVVADRSLSPSWGLRILGSPPYRWYPERLLPDPLSVREAVFHLGRSAKLVVSPLPFDPEGLEAQVLVLRGATNPSLPWEPLPGGGSGLVRITEEDDLIRASAYLQAGVVELDLPYSPEGLVGCRGRRTVRNLRTNEVFPPEP